MDDRDGEGSIVQVRAVRVAFGPRPVLEDIDLDVHRGEVLGIVGGSGSGKSMLLRIMLGLMQPDAGSVRVFGHDLGALGPMRMRRLQRRWGVLFQDDALFSSLTLGDNIRRVITEHARIPTHLLEPMVRLKISMVGMEPGVRDQYPAELSGGMRKQAGLARALALDPEILFLDEPTSGLDPLASTEFEDLINELRATLRFTVVLVSHNLDTLYATCDRIVVIAEQKLAATGTLDEVANTDHPWIQAFFHGPKGRRDHSEPPAAGTASG